MRELKLLCTLRTIFFRKNTETTLLIDADNAFISIIWKVMLHNMKFLCPYEFLVTYLFAMSHQQGSSFSARRKYYLT